MKNVEKKELLLKEEIEMLYHNENENIKNMDIYLSPPELDILTDENSGDEDSGGLIDNLNARQLEAVAEVNLRYLNDGINEEEGGSFTEDREMPTEKFDYLVGKDDRTWIKGDIETFLPQLPEPDYMKYSSKSSTEIFKMFLDNDIVEMLVLETNKYAYFKNKHDANITRGHYESVISKEEGILVCKWVDNSIVSLASNVNGVHPIDSVQRFSRKEKKFIQVQRPHIVSEYNKYMFGVDRMDENIDLYRISVRNKKWYWPILSWLIDVCVHNAWQIKRSSGTKITQLEFRREIVQVYLNKYKTQIKGPGTQMRPSQIKNLADIRLDGINHLVEEIVIRR